MTLLACGETVNLRLGSCFMFFRIVSNFVLDDLTSSPRRIFLSDWRNSLSEDGTLSKGETSMITFLASKKTRILPHCQKLVLLREYRISCAKSSCGECGSLPSSFKSTSERSIVTYTRDGSMFLVRTTIDINHTKISLIFKFWYWYPFE